MRKAYQLGFSNVEDELVIDKLNVTGKLPNWIEGTLYRNGPGMFKAGNQHYRHWFDGLSMLHKFTFKNGGISYANKFLQCKAYHEAKENDKISYSEFATDPCYSLFDRVKEIFDPKITDSAKVNVARLGGKFIAMGEPSLQIEFDPETLRSLGVYTYDDKPKQHITTVHPHEVDEQVINLTTRFGRVSTYRFMSSSKRERPELIAHHKVKEPAYLHSFGLSPSYLILTEFPYVVNPLKIIFHAKPFIENYVWKPKRGTRIFIFDRKTGKLVKQFKTDPFFAFHHVNAFEKGTDLYFDIVSYPDPEIIQSFYLDRITSEEKKLPGGEFRRYHADLSGKKEITYRTLSDEAIELPRFDYNHYNMDSNYQFVYSVGVNKSGNSSFYDQIVKNDLKTGEAKIWYEENCFPGEPVFLPAPNRKSEDDGVNLSVVLDEKNGNSFLLILDSVSFTEIARAVIPQPILFGYHGNFYQNDQ
ncbi:MAG: carotenoid oxygenase family protein [Balneolaceae bacterium]|nr:MAG: carotenoid oxygenase family protein [Balneolaceae bacterium]